MSSQQRVTSLDALRGTALCGVLLVNLLTDFRVPLLDWVTRFHTDSDTASHAVDWLLGLFVERKAFAVMSVLFGMSLGALSSSLGAKAAGVFARRSVFLLVLGALHATLVFSGDILMLYGVVGLLLVPLVNRSRRVLMAALVLAAVIRVVAPWPGVPLGASAEEMSAGAHVAYAGSFLEATQFRVLEFVRVMGPLELAVLPRTLALALSGLLLWNSGWHTRARGRWWVMVSALSLGAVCTGLEAWAASNAVSLGRFDALVGDLGVVGLALGYSLLLFQLPEDGRWVRTFAPLGRVSLSAYLMQTVLLGFVFYGYGLRLHSRLTSAQALLLGLCFFVTQLWLARVFLRRFRVGPLEALSRRLSGSAAGSR